MTEECNPFFRSESETTTYDNDPVALTVHSGMVERAVLMITAPQHSMQPAADRSETPPSCCLAPPSFSSAAAVFLFITFRPLQFLFPLSADKSRKRRNSKKEEEEES